MGNSSGKKKKPSKTPPPPTTPTTTTTTTTSSTTTTKASTSAVKKWGVDTSFSLPAGGFNAAYRAEFKSLVDDMINAPLNSTTQLQAINRLCNICYYEVTCRYDILMADSRRFLSGLVKVMRDQQGNARDNAIRTFLNLTLTVENRAVIGQSNCGFIPVGVAIMKSVDRSSNEFIFTHRIFNNLALGKENAQEMLASNFLEFNTELLMSRAKDHEANCCRTFRNILIQADDGPNFARFLSTGVHLTMMDILMANGSDAKKWPDRWTGTCYWCLGCLIEVAAQSSGAAALKYYRNCISYLTKLVLGGECEGVKASFILAFLVGKDESNDSVKSLLERYPNIYKLILDVFEDTLMANKGPKSAYLKGIGYSFAVIQMRRIMEALRVLSISDSNKRLMLESPLLPLILKTLQLYANNEKEIIGPAQDVFGAFDSAGGGGNDIETAEKAIELLSQLSFSFYNDQDLQRKYCDPRLNIPEILTTISTIRGPRAVGMTAQRQISNLLNRLTNTRNSVRMSKSDLANFNPTNVEAFYDDINTQFQPAYNPGGVSNQRQHIMLSYSWDCKKQYVSTLSYELRRLGYDVWRDEEGSTVVPAISGNAHQVMIEAIQKSYAVVICVSPQYKENSNCRTEALYCAARRQSNDLKIIFVMLDSEYHTTTPVAVDGWLRNLIGRDQWCPMWDDALIPSAAQHIASIVGSNSRLPDDAMGPQVVNAVVDAHAVVVDDINPQMVIAADHSLTNPYQQSEAVPMTNPYGVQSPPQQVKQINSQPAPSPAPQTQIPSTPQSPQSSTAKDFKTAWSIISDGRFASDPAALQGYLSDAGIFDQDDLQFLEAEHVQHIATLLKVVKKKQFLQCFNMS